MYKTFNSRWSKSYKVNSKEKKPNENSLSLILNFLKQRPQEKRKFTQKNNLNNKIETR
jgi:hypothetical protein